MGLRIMLKRILLCGLIAGLSGWSGDDPREESNKNCIRIWWAQWTPSDGLQKLGNEFETKTGIKVQVFQIPWPEYHNKVFHEFGKEQTDFDIVVGDSQWMGAGATNGFYLDLTDWLKKTVDIRTIHRRASRYLCEYPPGSGRYFAAPCETDACGFAYRKDWFEDQANKNAFKRKTKRDLAVPDTWDEFVQVAEFFTQPDKGRYGSAIITGRGYDGLVIGFGQVLYAFGGSWGNEETYRINGTLNSDKAVEALTFYKSLLKYAPPGGEKLDYFHALDTFKNGSAAMVMNYFAFFPGLVDQFGDKVGFFVMPSKNDRRVASLGGQGMSISTKTTPEKQKMAKQFIAWFLKLETQKKWVEMPACFTGNAELLKSEEFKKATPYNRALSRSVDVLQDFWNVPEFDELLTPAMKALGQVMDGDKTPKQALQEITEVHEKIMRKGGHRKRG